MDHPYGGGKEASLDESSRRKIAEVIFFALSTVFLYSKITGYNYIFLFQNLSAYATALFDDWKIVTQAL